MNNKKTVFIIIGVIIALVAGLGIKAKMDENKAEVSKVEQDNEEDIKENNEVNEVEETDEKEEENIEEEFVPKIAVGEKMLNFKLENLKGEEVQVTDYEGKILLINFWQTSCKYCDMEMPDLVKLEEENEDVVVLAVNVMESKDKVQKYIDKGGYGFEVVLDSDGLVSMDYLVSGFPATYFVNTDGIFMGRVPGMMTYEQMDEIVTNIREVE